MFGIFSTGGWYPMLDIWYPAYSMLGMFATRYIRYAVCGIRYLVSGSASRAGERPKKLQRLVLTRRHCSPEKAALLRTTKIPASSIIVTFTIIPKRYYIIPTASIVDGVNTTYSDIFALRALAFCLAFQPCFLRAVRPQGHVNNEGNMSGKSDIDYSSIGHTPQPGVPWHGGVCSSFNARKSPTREQHARVVIRHYCTGT